MFMIGTRVTYTSGTEDISGEIIDFLKDSKDELVGYIVKLDNGKNLMCALDEVVGEAKK